MTQLVRRPPEQHQTSVQRPPDFDQFWQAIMDEVGTIPLNPSIERIAMRSTAEVDVFEIHYDSLDNLRIAGWYCVPTERYRKGPYPGLLIVPGYVSEPTLPKSWAKLGYATVGVAPRGKLRSNSRFNPGYPGLLARDAVDPATYGYRGFYIDACRAVDFLQSRPEVDSSRIGVQGGSQGGALTLTTAALRSDAITCGAAGAPYLTGYMDAAGLTHSYPYEEINEYLRQYPESEPLLRNTFDYYDCLNFAPQITCPTLVSVGLGDDVCPPETGFDLQKVLTCPTEFNSFPRCAHDAGSFWHARRVEEFLAQHLKPATSAAEVAR